MYNNFSYSKNSSSIQLVKYLEKENDLHFEKFFNINDDYSISEFTSNEVMYKIDNNKGTRKINDTKFYLLNTSPSYKELKHLEKLAIIELENRGYFYDACKGNLEYEKIYNELKENIIKGQLKLYVKDILDKYAELMNREIYVNQDKLPSLKEREDMKPLIERRYFDFLKEKGIEKYNIIEEESEKIEVKFTNKRDLEEGSIFSVFDKQYNKNIEVFLPHSKFELDNQNRSVIIDKQYFEERKEYTKINKDLSKEKLFVNGKIEIEKSDSSYVSIKTNEYDKEIKLWVNNRDLEKEGESLIFTNKTKAENIINKAIERDIEQKKQVPIPCKLEDIVLKNGQEKGEKERVYIFSKVENGLKDPVKLEFKERDLVKRGNEFFAPKYLYEAKHEKSLNNAIQREFSDEKERIKNEIWKEKGFDVSKRKLEGKDLMYFSKIEHDRTYKSADKKVIFNKEILLKIKSSKNPFEISNLKSKLEKDFHTGEIIEEGKKKGGLNFHVHTIVSRYDKTSILPQDKVSMSPISNQRKNDAEIKGFSRENFFNEVEKVFDTKFDYNRNFKNTFEFQRSNVIVNRAKFEIKNFAIDKVKETIGIKAVMNEISPVQKIKSQISMIPIPTSIPKSKLGIIIKLGKMIKNVTIDRSIEM